MSKNIIHLLPDAVCNQIAAGEVIHRPASVVKELLDNSVDAQSSKITLVVEDNGNALIQVIDDGIGMSDVDLRMSLEKHATSKIKSGEDLFNIMTMGFRGEAIASIVSVAQVEIISCQNENELGSKIIVEGSVVKSQEPVAAAKGTIFSVKNLFYNIPVRRNFLKSPKSEMRHIVEEFTRSALAQPQIEYCLIHNGETVYKWPAAKLYNRVLDIFGEGYKKKLIHCYENTEFASLEGYIGDPSSARKTRDYQYLFVNNRFVKSPVLQKAIFDAYAKLIPPDRFPCYVLFLTLPPSEVDVNIHPSKTEVHFHNEDLLFAMIKSVIMKCLYQFDAVELDFNTENDFFTKEKNFTAEEDTFTKSPATHFHDDFKEKSYSKGFQQTIFTSQLKDLFNDAAEKNFAPQKENFIQIPPFIITTVKSGLLLIHQDRAEERIFYERYRQHLENNTNISQQLLFQQTIPLSQEDLQLVEKNQKLFLLLGFNFELHAENVVITGYPNFLDENKIADTFVEIVEKLRYEEEDVFDENLDKYLETCIRRIKHNYLLTAPEVESLTNQLFACSSYKYSPAGECIFKILDIETLTNFLL